MKCLSSRLIKISHINKFKSSQVNLSKYSNKLLPSLPIGKSFCENNDKKSRFNNYFKSKTNKIKRDNSSSGKEKENNTQAQEEFYEPTETLIFKENIYPILQMEESYKKKIKVIEYLLYVALGLTGYKTITSLLHIRPFRTILWGGAFFISARLFRGILKNKTFIISAINLLNDGKKVQLVLESGTKVVDIKDIRRITNDEARYFQLMMGPGHERYRPLVVDKEIYVIWKESTVYDKEILSAVSSGKYIKIKGENIIKPDDIIDI
jgi:hypothetical protein